MSRFQSFRSLMPAIPLMWLTFFVFQIPVFATSLGLPRMTIETEHFQITVDQNKKEVLPEAAAWLENAYAVESKFFAFETTNKTQVVLLDEEDFSNGFAYAQNQWIIIYLPPIRFTLRGTTQWFANVSAHELTHILTLRKMGLDSKFSGLDIFASLANSNKRFDGDAAWIPKSVPAWLAEGLAQYGSMHCGFDTLDSHREMLLREAWNSGNILPLKAIETYSADSRSSEMVYNQGFHLVDYLYRTYGSAAVNAMMKNWNSKGYAGSFRAAFGFSPDEIYSQWLKELDLRYTNSDARPEALSFFEAPYTVEDAPVYDAKTQTLYYLSSEPNDFGETHLYANRRKQGAQLIQRDVDPPLHLASDGSLLYPAVRIDSKTGARTSHLYRYNPYTGEIATVTDQLRIISGVATKSGDVYAIVRRSGKTLIARISHGWMQQEFDAPAGMEFTDLTAESDSSFYVSVAQGNNTDIYHLNFKSKTFTAVLASRHNERDPFVLNDCLYFSSDADGGYSIYSLQGKNIFRHTPRGPSAFAPFTDGNTLYYSLYTPHGFVLRAQALDSGELSAELGDPSNAPFTTPPAISLSPLESDRTHLELVEYSGSLGYAHAPHSDVDLGGDVLRYNPCAQQSFVDGNGYWSDPDGRNVLAASLALGQCVDVVSQPYVPLAYLQYENHDFTPDIFLQGVYQSTETHLSSQPEKITGLNSAYGIFGGLVFHLGSYFYNTGELQFNSSRLNLNSDNYQTQTTSQFGIGDRIGLSLIDPGMDFINRGILGSVGFTNVSEYSAGSSASALITQGNLELHWNIARFLFLTGLGSFVNDGTYSDQLGTLSGDVCLPEGLTLGGVGYGGLYLESIFLHGAYSAENANGYSYLSLIHSQAFSPGLMPGNLSQRAASPGYIFSTGIPVTRMIELAIRLKTITPSSRVAYWNFGWQAPPDDLHGGYYSISLSL